LTDQDPVSNGCGGSVPVLAEKWTARRTVGHDLPGRWSLRASAERALPTRMSAQPIDQMFPLGQSSAVTVDNPFTAHARKMHAKRKSGTLNTALIRP
jgi:hypothetical protein